MKPETPPTEAGVRDRVDGDVRIELVPDGPAVVRGSSAVRDAEGTAYPSRRPVVAVCVCGLSQRGPWCDATHKLARGTRKP